MNKRIKKKKRRVYLSFSDEEIWAMQRQITAILAIRDMQKWCNHILQQAEEHYEQRTAI